MLAHKTLSLSECDIKLAGDGAATFEGYASKFNLVDSYGDTILPGAYADTLKQNGQPKMYGEHSYFLGGSGLPIGKWQASEDDTGLYVRGELTKGMSLANDYHAALKHGTIDGLSVGGMLSPADYEEKDTGGRIIKRWTKLVEVSIVAFPADKHARVDLDTVKSAMLSAEISHLETIKDFERFLRDAGGLSKGLALALTSRAKSIFRSDSDGAPEAKAMQELDAALKRLQARIPQ